LFNAKCGIFQPYHGENKLLSIRWWWCPLCTRQVWFIAFL